MSRADAFNKPCPGCGGNVHVRARVCKACGGPSPWPEKPADEINSSTKEGEEISADQAPAPAVDESRRDPPEVVHLAKPTIAPPMPHVAPVAPPPARAIRYVAAETFSTTYADQFLRFVRFQEIPHHLVEELLKREQPIVDSELIDTIIACPHCKRLFTPAPKKRAARNAA